jgi:hypothetical protein
MRYVLKPQMEMAGGSCVSDGDDWQLMIRYGVLISQLIILHNATLTYMPRSISIAVGAWNLELTRRCVFFG